MREPFNSPSQRGIPLVDPDPMTRADLFREHGIAVMGYALQAASDNQTPLPSEAYAVYERMINSMQVEKLADAVRDQFEDFEARLRHLETGREIDNAQAPKNRTRNR